MIRFRHRIVEMVARMEPLHETLERICLDTEAMLGGGSVTVMGVDVAGMMRVLAAPNFAQPYREALNAIVIGPEVGSCGSAIYRNEPVHVADIEHDARWAVFKTLALPLGLKACHSSPIRDEHDKAIGAIALYLGEARLPTQTEAEIMAVAAELCELVLFRERRASRDKLGELDPLTGAPGNDAFHRTFQQMRCELPGSWAVAVVGLDNLRAINEAYGRRAGDALLRMQAERLARALAPDLAFRTGADEFTAIIQDRDALRHLDRLAKRLSEMLETPLEFDGQVLQPMVSFGVSVLAPQQMNPQQVRQNAEFALSRARESAGRNVRYSFGEGQENLAQNKVIGEVLDALRDNRIDAYYQPILKLGTRQIVGFEALARMTSPSGHMIPASFFAEAFSDVQVACQLTDHLLRVVARDLRSWLDEGLPIQHVSLNVTSADFYARNLPEELKTAFGALELPLTSLVVEVTENAYMGSRDRVVANGIAELRVAGVRVALDDFGTGFAALTHLLTIPVNSLKIDQSFVRRMALEEPALAITRGIVQIARDLNICVIAEGCETEEQIRALVGMGCNFGQGFAFSKAVRRDKAAALFRLYGEGMPGSCSMRYGVSGTAERRIDAPDNVLSFVRLGEA